MYIFYAMPQGLLDPLESGDYERRPRQAQQDTARYSSLQVARAGYSDMVDLTLSGMIGLQCFLQTFSLAFIVARIYIRLCHLSSSLNISDYFVLAGWILCLGWTITTILALDYGSPVLIALDSDSALSVAAKKALFAANFTFDVGLFCPKASLLGFYYDLFPVTHRKERIALYLVTGYIACACVVTLLSDFLTCTHTSDNWSEDPDACSTWFSLQSFIINYSLNVSSDLLVFGLPFMLLPQIHADRKTKWGIAGTFFLGALTISICTVRFVWGDLVSVFPITVILLCTAEFTTALIVVCLPILRPLIIKKKKVAWPEHNDRRIEEALKGYEEWSEFNKSAGSKQEMLVEVEIREANVA